MKLQDYVKHSETELISTTVTIRKTQKEFVASLNLNLSKMVRDYLDQIMEAENAKKKNK